MSQQKIVDNFSHSTSKVTIMQKIVDHFLPKSSHVTHWSRRLYILFFTRPANSTWSSLCRLGVSVGKQDAHVLITTDKHAHPTHFTVYPHRHSLSLSLEDRTSREDHSYWFVHAGEGSRDSQPGDNCFKVPAGGAGPRLSLGRRALFGGIITL